MSLHGRARVFRLKNGSLRIYFGTELRHWWEGETLRIDGRYRIGISYPYKFRPWQKWRRYCLCGASSLVWCAGFLIIDTKTGLWIRKTIRLDRAQLLVDTLNFYEKLRKKFDAPVWPARFLRTLDRLRATAWQLGWKRRLEA